MEIIIIFTLKLLTELVLMFSVLLVFIIIYLIYCIFSIQHSLFIRSLCRVKTTEKIVFLSFDDGPSSQFTAEILDELKRRDIKAVFFCIGNHAESSPGLVKRIVEEGHLIGNHTYSHDWALTLKSSHEFENELEKAETAIKSIIGREVNLFRPPFGVTNPSIAKAVKKRNLLSIGWDIRSLDTVITDPDKLRRRIIRKLRPGSIILLHDNRCITSLILSELIDDIESNGYKIVPLKPYLSLN
ncbi:MAG: polysaccharide deacetylase family protein [Bacteroidetes bacterium]|nr:polysaccharide deacetylase family protein [Bacteroidota bacterium]